MWIFLLLIFCQSSEAETSWKELGETVIINIPGDLTGGCQIFLHHPSSPQASCCFSAPFRYDTLCIPEQQNATCRLRGKKAGEFSMEEKEGHCVLRLPDFQHTDDGVYKIVFPGKLDDNREMEVVGYRPAGPVVGYVFLSIILTAIVAGTVFFFWRYLWPGRKGGKEARDKKDEEVMKSLKELKTTDKEILNKNNIDDFKKILGSRKLCRVVDKEGDTIFHLAAAGNWPEEMTKVVVERLQEESVPVLQRWYNRCLEEGANLYAFTQPRDSTRSSVKDVEAQSGQDVPLDPAKENSGPSQGDIFKVPISNWIDWVPEPVMSKWKPEWLISRAIDLDAQNKKGQTPLHIVVSGEDGGEDLVSSLLEQNVKRDLVDNMKDSPLHIAVKNENLPLVKLLLPKGENTNDSLLKQKNSDDKTVIQVAVASKPNVNIVGYIITELEDTCWKAGELTLIFSAIETGNKAMIELLKKNISQDILDNGLITHAVKEHGIKVIKYILKDKTMWSEQGLKAAHKDAMDLNQRDPTNDDIKEVLRLVETTLSSNQPEGAPRPVQPMSDDTSRNPESKSSWKPKLPSFLKKNRKTNNPDNTQNQPDETPQSPL